MLKYNLIAAASKNRGIGKNNDLPWKLKKEFQYFTKMTVATTSESKKNVVVMGRRTWEGIHPNFKPLPNRINFILSRSDLNFENEYDNVFCFKSWDEINEKLCDKQFEQLYETIWILGGSNVYKEALESKYFYRLYLTEINKEYDCDTFFPEFDNVKTVSDPNVPTGIQEEDGVTYEFKVYENTLFKE